MLRWSGKLSARQVCIIAWWCVKAGMQGCVKDIAERPSLPKNQWSHYQRKLDQALGYKESQLDQAVLEVPGNSAASSERVVHKMRVVIPHEALDTEMEESDEAAQAELRQAVAEQQFPDSYYDHALVRLCGPMFFPRRHLLRWRSVQ